MKTFTDDDDVVGLVFNDDWQGGRPTATLWVGDQETGLTYEKVCALAARANQIRSEMEWAMAEWVLAGCPPLTETWHLMHKGEHGSHARTLCGRGSTVWNQHVNAWRLEPFMGTLTDPRSGTCKRCLASARKRRDKEQ